VANGIYQVGSVDDGVRDFVVLFSFPREVVDAFLLTKRTLFWGGDTFAPKLRVMNKAGTEVSVQEFLQSTFLDMFDKLVEAVGDLDSVIGFEVGVQHSFRLNC